MDVQEQPNTIRYAPYPSEAVPFSRLADMLPHIKIRREDIAQLGFSDKEIAELTEEDLALIGQRIRQHLLHVSLYEVLGYHVMEKLNKSYPHLN